VSPHAGAAACRIVTCLALSWAACTTITTMGATFCVQDSAGFEAALATAATNGQDDFIKLAPGIYTPTGTSFAFSSSDLHGLSIAGGFGTGPGLPLCGAPLEGSQWTILDGAGVKSLLNVAVGGASAAPVYVRGLTIQHGVKTAGSDPLLISGYAEWTGDVILENVLVRANQSNLFVASLGSNGHIIVRGSAFVGNTSANFAGGAISLISNRQGTGIGVIFNSNTVAGNVVQQGSSRAGLAISGTGQGDVRIANNIFWNNGGGDLNVSVQATVYLDHDDIGSRSIGPSVTVVETSSFNTDPQFELPQGFRLKSTSPLRDSGAPSPIGGTLATDIEGMQRAVFGGVDIGAYEIQDRIFANDFE
jgi:hypothetical protein